MAKIAADKASLMLHPVWAGYPLLHRVAELFLDFHQVHALLYNLTSSPSERANMSLRDANNLDSAFTWHRTHQGGIFWASVHEHLRDTCPAYMHAILDYDYHYDDIYPAVAAVTPDVPQIDTHSVILDGVKRPKTEWQPDKADGDHVMSVTRDMF